MIKNVLGLSVLFLLFFVINSTAQEKWSVTAGMGTASGNSAVEGFYYSFDLGIPLSKSLELAPTFNFFSTLPTKRLDNSWTGTGSTYTSEDISKNYYSGDIMGSISLVLLFKPLALLDAANEKHELAIGAGLGVKSYATVRSGYDQTSSTLSELGAKSAWSVEPYYLKLFYKYHFSDRFFVGPVASIDGFDGEAVALFGVQFGVNLQ